MKFWEHWTGNQKSLAIAIVLVLVFLFFHLVSNAQANAQYFRITQYCHLGDCHQVKKASLTITPTFIFIRGIGELQTFRILKKSRINNYDLYEFDSYTFIKIYSTYAQVIKWNDVQQLTIIKA
jgi:hypothetical protein